MPQILRTGLGRKFSCTQKSGLLSTPYSSQASSNNFSKLISIRRTSAALDPTTNSASVVTPPQCDSKTDRKPHANFTPLNSSAVSKGRGIRGPTYGPSGKSHPGHVLSSEASGSVPSSARLNPVQEARRLLLRKLKLEYGRVRGTSFSPRRQSLHRSRNIGFDRVFCGPKLRKIKRDYLIIHEPYRSAISEREEEEETLNVGQPLVRRTTHSSQRRGKRIKALEGYHKMRSYVQFLTTPTADTPGTTLLLHFDNKRYLFGNISEGTQRACVQRKISLAKIEDIFLTGKVDWHSTGGILGMILTLADVIGTQQASLDENEKGKDKKKDKKESEETRKLRLHGARNLTHLLATARRFIFRKGMPVEVDEIREPSVGEKIENDISLPTWSDENIRVWSMPISPRPSLQSTRKRSHDEISDMGVTSGGTCSANGTTESPEEREDREDQLRKGVVAHMFDSDWRLDALNTVKLADVRLPAAIFIRNEQGRIEKYNGPLPGAGEVVPDIEVLVRNPWPGAAIEVLPPTEPSLFVISYIIKNHPQRGKFNPAEALRLGVKKGAAFRELTMGHSITTEQGSVVTPDMVMAPGKEGGGFAVVEVPDKSYIDPLLDRAEWTSKEVMNGVGSIVWICGKGVLNDKRLKAFVSNNGLENIFSSSDLSPNNLALESPATAAIRLHLLDSVRFPVPVHSNSTITEVGITGTKARVGNQINLEPAFGLEDKGVVGYLDTARVIKEMSPEILVLAAEARKKVEDSAYVAKLDQLQRDIPSIDAEVTTLGTGSALPSKYRNVSATLLRVPGHGNYLFDCGENTLGQLKRVFGSELPEILQDLKVIWISHLHADHHLGTAAVIRAWDRETSRDSDQRSKRLTVASDHGMLKWLEEYSSIEDYGYSRVEPLYMGHVNNFHETFSTAQTTQLGLASIQACHVSHCHNALAVVFNFPNGFKVAYSGDCRPSQDFARIGRGATLLIHEATFDDELQGDAIAKKHSTTSEALDIGRRMGARRILLTHFSQRYQKIPVMDDRDGKDQVAIVAFDYMKCKLGDFAKLAEFRPALLKLYEEKEE
ncbi:MAG: hypothetical protein M1818_006512 [Claussenomyces sp. TS43310]|nr:MAG: hypothetical protein M1818_006512 [Claussenomyces sp. TS43310]